MDVHSEPSHASALTQHKKRSLLERLSDSIANLVSPEPDNRQDLLEVLQAALDKNLIDADALSMIEGVLQVSELSARDMMIPRAQMEVVDISEPTEKWLPQVLQTAHSRFPATEGKRDEVVGILLAKDLLRYFTEKEFDVRGILRPAVFIPESKRLNVLLRDFRANRNHMAIVLDEYGSVAGLITIEDVLEQIVGEIDDEYDFEDDESHIVAEGNGVWRVKALTELEQINQTLGTELLSDEADTLGGLIAHTLGRMPKKGEVLELEGLHIEVLRADARQVHMLKVKVA